MTFDEILDAGLRRRIKRHIIAGGHIFLAVCQPGFEKTCEGELNKYGASDIKQVSPGGVEFKSDLSVCHMINYSCRTINKILLRILGFRAIYFEELREKASKIPWELYVSDGMNLIFSTTCRKSRLYHTDRIETEITGAIKARLADYSMSVSFGKKKDGLKSQEVLIRAENDVFQISLDTSGELLYRRGSRQYISEAPIRETTAAAILMESSIENYDAVIDPMCGSGTFSIEAAGIFGQIHPGQTRAFAFMDWPSFKPGSYRNMIKKLPACVLSDKIILASDIHGKAVETAGMNISASGLTNTIALAQKDFFAERIDIPHDKKCLIVLNPPYGKRLEKSGAEKIYRNIGKTIKEYYPSCGYAVIVPGLDLEKKLSLSYDKKILFKNGGIDVGVIIKYGF